MRSAEGSTINESLTFSQETSRRSRPAERSGKKTLEVTPATVIVLTDRQRMVVTDEPESVVASIGRARAARLASVARLKRTRNADVIPFRPRAVAG